MEFGRKAPLVTSVSLNPLLGDPREQIRRRTVHLPIHSRVLVLCSMKPVPLALPTANWLEISWYRPDLYWEFLEFPAWPEWASAWRTQAEYLGARHD